MQKIILLAAIFFLTIGTPLSAAVAPAPAEAPAMATPTEIRDNYLASLRAMTPAERRAYRKSKRKEIRAALRDFKQHDAREQNAQISQAALIIACLIPPLGVFLYEGVTNRFWIALLLTLLLYLPGFIYAVLVVTGSLNKKRK